MVETSPATHHPKTTARGDVCSVTFDTLYVTIEAKAPILMGILRSCILPTSAKIHYVSLMCLAMLIKTHHSFSVVQMYLSLILYAGHAGKQVISELYILF